MIFLVACDQSNVPSNVEEQEDAHFSPPLYSTYDFDSYEEIIQALTMNETESYNEIRQRNAHLELGEVYMNTLSAFEMGEKKLVVPQLCGVDIQFRNRGKGYSNIALFSEELYGLPWIWYYCIVDNLKLTVRTMYVSVLEEERIDNAKTALEVVRLLDPDAPNPQNYKEFDAYKKIYEKEIELSDRKVKALVFELNDDSRIYVDIYYDDVYIRLTAEKELLSKDFFKKFSIRYVS